MSSDEHIPRVAPTTVGLQRRMMTELHILRRLEQLVRQKRSVLKAAKHLGISDTYLHDVLEGKRNMGPKLLKALHLTRHRIYLNAETKDSYGPKDEKGQPLGLGGGEGSGPEAGGRPDLLAQLTVGLEE